MTRSITIEDLFSTSGPDSAANPANQNPAIPAKTIPMKAIPIADVRSPSEFTHGHIPGAVNLPLFSDEERARVGTTYKQQGREAAILLGFELTGPKWAGFIQRALEISPGKRIALHCWRGGMRSAAMAWALDLYGFDVNILRGGYKTFRSQVHTLLAHPYNLSVLGGMTGSGKTRILARLRELGHPTIDLEDIAQHCGSTYGSLNRLVQPTQEQFENELAMRLARLDDRTPIWIEDESQNVGRCLLPKPFWTQLRAAPLFDLQVPVEHRIDALVEEYGGLDRDFLVECTERINRRLGPEQAKAAVTAIREGRMTDFIRQVLIYYDKTYRKGLTGREPDNIFPVPASDGNVADNAARLLAIAKNRSPAWTFN